MGFWALVVDREDWLYADIAADLPAGEQVLLIGPGPVLFGAGRSGPDGVIRPDRTPGEPVPVELDLPVGSHPLDEAGYQALAGRLPIPTPPSEWLVTVSIPVEARSPGDAVRQFWSFVRELGPRELPAFVSPRDDELAMQAYVLGVETNQDPEEG